MTLCPCGCGGPARTPKGYARRGCCLRMIPKEVRAARAKAWADAHRTHYVEMGRKSNKRSRPRRYDDLLVRWNEIARTKGPSAALSEAYRRGYQSGYLAGVKQPRKAKREAA